MRVKITGCFGSVQRQIIRVAAIVAAANFPMPYMVEVRKMSRKLGKRFDGFAREDEGRYFVDLAGGQDHKGFFKTASHEFRHISDLYIGNLTETPNPLSPDGWDFVWKGRKVGRLLRHTDQPHERVAYRYENRLIPRRT